MSIKLPRSLFFFFGVGELYLQKLLNKGVYILCFNFFILVKTYTKKPQDLHLEYYSYVPEQFREVGKY